MSKIIFILFFKSNKTNIIIYTDPGRSMMFVKYSNIIRDLVFKKQPGRLKWYLITL